MTVRTESSQPQSKDLPQKSPKIPTHVAIIMDGNGRWAQKRGLPRLDGHRMGVDRIHCVLETLGKKG